MLLTDSDILKFDRERLCLIYEEWPRYFKEAANICHRLDHTSDFYNSIVLCGMGGSATSCDILHDLIYSSSTIPVTVVRGQKMPYNVDEHSLVIVNSISGNTTETILNMQEATARKAEVVCYRTRKQTRSRDKAIKDLRLHKRPRIQWSDRVDM
jgi:glucose/mannose-6-phosphate isomerase